jgi:hypothetical protein
MTAPRAKHNRRGAHRSRAEDQHADGADLHGATRKLRCAVYTRKSSEEGLEMEFNSLDAQREACEAFIASQRGEGWILVPDRYDDGGVSGGTLDRPALKRLLADVEAGRIDIVVVYKVDRLFPLAARLSQAHRDVRTSQDDIRVHYPVVQYDRRYGSDASEHHADLRPI